MKPSNEQILRDALDRLIDVAEACDNWSSFPHAAISEANAALAATAPESAPADAPGLIYQLAVPSAVYGMLRWYDTSKNGYIGSREELRRIVYTHPAPSQSADQVREVSDPLISRQVSIWQAEVTRLRDLIHVATSSAAKGEAALQALVDQSQELGLYDSAADARDAARWRWAREAGWDDLRSVFWCYNVQSGSTPEICCAALDAEVDQAIAAFQPEGNKP